MKEGLMGARTKGSNGRDGGKNYNEEIRRMLAILQLEEDYTERNEREKATEHR